MAVPPPPMEEFEGFSFPAASFAAGSEWRTPHLRFRSVRSWMAGVFVSEATLKKRRYGHEVKVKFGAERPCHKTDKARSRLDSCWKPCKGF